MSVIDTTLEIWDFNRDRTFRTLDEIAGLPDPADVLGWRASTGHAHIAWQLTHIGITEELFATERLAGTSAAYPNLVPRFRGGSTPDDDIPTLDNIRDVLTNAREHLRNTLSTFTESDLGTIPEPLRERDWTLATVLKLLAWHEAHHQGQAHATLNLWKTAHN